MARIKGSALVMSAVFAFALASAASADSIVTSKTSTTSYSGTISEIQEPSSTIVVRSEKAPEPMRYQFNEKTVWVDSTGNTVSMSAVRNQPVTVHYVKEGPEMVVTRVEVQKPVSTIEKKTTTTTTEELH
jgi:hypothetical protein